MAIHLSIKWGVSRSGKFAGQTTCALFDGVGTYRATALQPDEALARVLKAWLGTHYGALLDALKEGRAFIRADGRTANPPFALPPDTYATCAPYSLWRVLRCAYAVGLPLNIARDAQGRVIAFYA